MSTYAYRYVQRTHWDWILITALLLFAISWQDYHAADIFTVDPYTIAQVGLSNGTNGSRFTPAGMGVRTVGGVVSTIVENVLNGGLKPLWMAVQSFGGTELWTRQPTPGELRAPVMIPQHFTRLGRSAFRSHGLNFHSCVLLYCTSMTGCPTWPCCAARGATATS